MTLRDRVHAYMLDRLMPERMRIAVIDPRQDGEPAPPLSERTIQGLRMRDMEIIKIDGKHPRHEYPNGLLLADFFDFT